MKSLATLFWIFFSFAYSSYSQHLCNTDHQHDLFLEDYENRAKFAFMNEKILEEIILRRSGGGSSEVSIIPTVVHVIHNNGEENISLDQVDNAILWLNEAYTNSGGSFNTDGTEIPIQFCLAKKNPDGDFTEGVNYVQNNLTDMLVPSQDLDLKDLSRWDPLEYLNIWVVKSITREDNSPGVVGYSTFPDSHGSDSDGIVLEADYFGATQTSNNVLAHESGHYLGLFHTFQNGCPNDDCLTSGDMVCDTPPDQNLFNVFCFDGTNSCSTDEDDTSDNNPFRAEGLGGLGDQLDQQTNYMDYSSILCFDIFSVGQAERMVAALELRNTLFEDDKCAPPCNDPVVASVASTPSFINVGESINYNNLSSNYTDVQWSIDNVPISTNDNFTFSPSVQGEYLIDLELNNDTPGCYQILTFSVQVVCPITVEVFPNTTNVSEGGTVDFSASTTGADTFEWFVDNISVGNTEQFSNTFNEVGTSSVFMVASNGVCEVMSQVWNVSVGNCSSGNEHNIWHWLNETGLGFGFDFNENPVSLLDDPGIFFSNCKSTICDQAGNLMFLTNGETVFDRNYDIVENGSGLLGHISSSHGAMFIPSPANESEYYLFTSSASEVNFEEGIRYSMIDTEANFGLGLVTEVKNEFVEVSGIESLNIIKHCNLKDKWLVFYDLVEESFKAYLIDENGVSTTPIVTPLDMEISPIAHLLPIKPSPQGDRLFYNEYLLNFNQATGGVESSIHIGEQFPENFDAISYEFSPNGKVLYVLSGFLDVEINQYDLTLPDNLMANPVNTINGGLEVFHNDLQKGKDGILYMSSSFSGTIATISNPNLLGNNMDYNPDAIQLNTTLDNFGSYYHSFIAGQDIIIDGDEIVCGGSEHEFSIFGSDCINSNIDWEFSGDGTFIVNANETVSAVFPENGMATLVASTNTDCGLVTDTLHISIIESPDLDLGADIGYCSDDLEITLQIPEEYEFYLWSDGSTESTLTLNSPEPQIIEARGYYQGCYSTDEIEILGEIDGTIDLGEDLTLCDGVAIVLDAGVGFSDYEWQDGSSGQTYTVFLGGIYTVSANGPCEATDMIFIDECDQTINSVEDQTFSESFIAYPNPASDDLLIEFQMDASEELSAEIVDVMGRIVYSEIFNSKLGNNLLRIEVKNFSPGDYIFRIRGNSLEWNEKLVVSKSN